MGSKMYTEGVNHFSPYSPIFRKEQSKFPYVTSQYLQGHDIKNHFCRVGYHCFGHWAGRYDVSTPLRLLRIWWPDGAVLLLHPIHGEP